MQAYLIDPYRRTVEPVEYGGDIHQIYEYIEVETFAAATFNENGDTVFVDDEGLLPHRRPSTFFLVEGYPQPLAGKGLVLGMNDEGESVAPTVTLEDLRHRITFMNLYEALHHAQFQNA